MTDTITVAVATRGRPDGLARCLAALAGGTVLPDQLIVVDQSSTPETRAIAGRCGLPNLLYLEQRRDGLSASRNLGLANALGTVLAVTDDDCVADPGWVAAILGAFGRAPVPTAVSGPILPLGPRPPGGHAVASRPSREAADHRGRTLPWLAGSGGNFAAHTESLRRAGGWDERLGAGSPGRAAEDLDLLYRLLRDGQTVRYEPAALVCHEWQTLARRRATRVTYGFGIGAFCGVWLRAGDPFAACMLLAFLGLQGRVLGGGAVRRDRRAVLDAARMLASIGPGLAYGARIGPRPPGPSVGGGRLDRLDGPGQQAPANLAG